MRSYFLKISVSFLASIVLFNAGLFPVSAAPSLAGRILLQVEDKGQAWYVNPVNYQRYYLGRPDDAFLIMRSLGLGVSNADLAAFFKNPPTRLAGRILLQVEDKGQAYYLDPVSRQFFYLGRPADAFAVMRSQGLGITNIDLAKIAIAASQPASSAVSIPATLGTISEHRFAFKYQNKNYEITQNLSSAWYDSYRTSTKVYTYSGSQEPAGLRDSFYGLFLDVKAGDSSLDDLISRLRAIAVRENWSDDELIEAAMALIQYIPYDSAKLAGGNTNTNPYYPYETLYLDRGVCSDKTFLAVAVLRRLGYGAAIFDFPDLNHTAAGVSCPIEYSLANTGYCYIETTNYFPLGVIPKSIDDGQANNVAAGLSELFDYTRLGKIEVYQKSTGRSYSGIAKTHKYVTDLIISKSEIEFRQAEINSLKTALEAQAADLLTLKSQLDAYYSSGQFSKYNNLVPSYNSAVDDYNSDLAAYQTKVEEYNTVASTYNNNLQDFYQN